MSKYINIIEEKLNEYLDNLYASTKKITISLDNDIILSLIKIITNLIDKTDFSDINTLLTIDSSKTIVYDTINKYYFYYIILRLAFTDLDITFIKNSFISLQSKLSNYTFIDLDPNTISNYIKFILLIRDINSILAKTNNSDKKNYAINFLNNFNENFIFDNLTESNIHYKHNIIKLVLKTELYNKIDKGKIYKLIQDEEYNRAEKKKIFIVEAIYEELDIAYIEKIFSTSKNISYNNIRNYTNFFYDLILNSSSYTKINIINDGIEKLFASKIIIPITDEFLRYHKNSERIEIIKDNIKKKDNTKTKYIIDKINNIINIYNNNSDKNDKIFESLAYRKAYIINDIEELNVINRLLTYDSITNINNIYLDLIEYRKYPYVNFNNFKTYGTIFKFNDESYTIESLRASNFEYFNSSIMQTRIVNHISDIKIVGLALNLFNPLRFNNIDMLACFDNSSKINLTTNKSGYILLCSYLKDYILKDNNFNKLPYWLFDYDKDKNLKVNISYDNYSNYENFYKELIYLLYQNIQELLFEKIINSINGINTDRYKSINLLYTLKIFIDYIQNKIIHFNKDSNYLEEIYQILYYKKFNLPQSIDTKENIIPGYTTKLLKLPLYTLDKPDEFIIKIKKYDILVGKKLSQDITEYEYALCQHIITWDNINKLKIYNPNKFYQELFIFIKKFVIENNDKDFICKSCFQLVDIKKYISDSYDQNMQNIALTISLETTLENISEYEKYNKAIKNIDKILEKLAYILGIQYYLGNSPTIKYRRQYIIKNVIDIINIQNMTFDKSDQNFRRNRSDRANKLYGVSKISNFFIFEMDNNIYTYSSKDIDKFKRYKNNNIIIYIILFIIINLNLDQIINSIIGNSYDKNINYEIFDKYGKKFFSPLHIRINNSDTIKSILEYELLCYVIYHISAVISKYGLPYWYIDDNKITKKNMINPLIQNIIINTFVDMINSILEINTNKTKNYLYENIAIQFFNKLFTIYSNNNSYDTIIFLKSLTKQTKKNKLPMYKLIKANSINIDGIFKSNITTLVDDYSKVKSILMTYPKSNIYKNIDKYYSILDKNHKIKIISNYEKTGNKRNTMLDKSKINLANIDNDYQIIYSNKLNKLKSNISIIPKKLININNLIDIKKLYDSIKDINKIIDQFIYSLTNIIGSDIDITNKYTLFNSIYLNKNIYIIDHKYDDSKLESSKIITDNIIFINNHEFFNSNVIQYFDNKYNIYYYYSQYNYVYLGYKESNNKFTLINNSSNSIIIDYSIKYKIINFGYDKRIYPINKDINDIITIRLANIKNSIIHFQSIFFKLINSVPMDDTIFYDIKFDLDKYPIIYHDEYGISIFEYFDELNNTIFCDKINDSFTNYIDIDSLNLNNNDSFALFYFINQLLQLLDLNKEYSTNYFQLAKLIILFFYNYYNIFMNDYNSIDIKLFLLYESIEYLYEDTTIIEELTDEQKDQIIEDNERDDAIDVDLNVDQEDLDTYDETDPDNEVIYMTDR